MSRHGLTYRISLTLAATGVLAFAAACVALAATTDLLAMPDPCVMTLIGTLVLSFYLVRRHRASMIR